MVKVVMAGGGTAGHVNPLLATAAQLRDSGAEVVVLGTKAGLEADLVPAAGFPLVEIPRVPLPRRPSLAFFTLPSRFSDAVKRCEQALEGADVLVGFGGYPRLYRCEARWRSDRHPRAERASGPGE